MSGHNYGEIPRFVEELAYLRGLNVGITIGLQSLSQLKKKYKDSWESVLDCVDSILFLGSSAKESLEYIVSLLGKKTWYKKSTGRTFSKQGSSSTNWDVVGRELATLDELSVMPSGYCVLFIARVGAFYSKLFDLKEKEQKETINDLKGEQKDIAWGSQIRSYVFCPYTLVKDHRTNYEVGNVQTVMDGNLDGFIESYLKYINSNK